jgi:hypothetical protein
MYFAKRFTEVKTSSSIIYFLLFIFFLCRRIFHVIKSYINFLCLNFFNYIPIYICKLSNIYFASIYCVQNPGKDIDYIILSV